MRQRRTPVSTEATTLTAATAYGDSRYGRLCDAALAAASRPDAHRLRTPDGTGGWPCGSAGFAPSLACCGSGTMSSSSSLSQVKAYERSHAAASK